jgi:hypothetical protein
MAISTFDGPVRSLGGFYAQGPNSIINLANGTNTITLTTAGYAGRLIKTNDATLVVTLPTIIATAYPSSSGPGADPNSANNIGTTYSFVVETTASALVFQTDGTDKFVGGVFIGIDDGADGKTFISGASNDVCTLNGTTKGGIAGSIITFTAIASAKYLVQGNLLGSGVLVTPFSDS